jgi:glycerol-3-phosphate acyltransferase PlsY
MTLVFVGFTTGKSVGVVFGGLSFVGFLSAIFLMVSRWLFVLLWLRAVGLCGKTKCHIQSVPRLQPTAKCLSSAGATRV